MAAITPEAQRDVLRAQIRDTACLPRSAIADLVRTSQDRFIHIAASAYEVVATERPVNEWSLHNLVRHAIAAEGRTSRQVHELGAGRMPNAYNLPDGVTMEIPDEGQLYASLIEQLQAVNTAMFGIIAEAPSAFDSELRSIHTYAGPMNCLEWAVFQHIHDDSHSAYAHKIIAALGGT